MAKCKARMVIESENAALVEQTIMADNPEYVRTVVEQGRVIVYVEAANPGSMLATLDDLLVNLKVAVDLLDDSVILEGQED